LAGGPNDPNDAAKYYGNGEGVRFYTNPSASYSWFKVVAPNGYYLKSLSVNWEVKDTDDEKIVISKQPSIVDENILVESGDSSSALYYQFGSSYFTESYIFCKRSGTSGHIKISSIMAIFEQDTITGITLKSAPTKTEYAFGEQLDLSGCKINVSYTHVTASDVEVTSSMVSGFNSERVGQQTVTITYEGKTTSFAVKIADVVTGITLKSEPTKTLYEYDESLDLSGCQITVHYQYQQPKDVDGTSRMMTGYNRNQVGEQVITISYKDKSATFVVSVLDAIANITLKSEPTKTQYVCGEQLDLSGCQIRVNYQHGQPHDVDVTYNMISGYNKRSVGFQTLTVTYEGKTATFSVEVVEQPEETGLSRNTIIGIVSASVVFVAICIDVTIIVIAKTKKKKH
ncbi:MAG: bacterial Ig-like domain-containing protein, partial [Clostridia bacterium]|nr:bacterial Ig-like domain-containing protein [Clostridia bacterium]